MLFKRWTAHCAYWKRVLASLVDTPRSRRKLRRVFGHLYLLLGLEIRWLTRGVSRPNRLGRPLIISLTSYPPRFPTLYLTLQCLLTQSVRPDQVILSIAQEDADRLPESVRLFTAFGLSIRFWNEDIRSYKKIVPTLQTLGFDAYHVICDDDQHYTRDWLESFLDETTDGATVLCHDGRCIANNGAHIRPYADWHAPAPGLETPKLVPFGGGGVFYPPNILTREVLDRTLFLKLCPDQDDLWLYWHARLNGAKIRAVNRTHTKRFWIGSQETALWQANNPIGGGNDQAVRHLASHFGLPFDVSGELDSLPETGTE